MRRIQHVVVGRKLCIFSSSVDDFTQTSCHVHYKLSATQRHSHVLLPATGTRSICFADISTYRRRKFRLLQLHGNSVTSSAEQFAGFGAVGYNIDTRPVDSLLFGRHNKPHYGPCPSIRLSVCLSRMTRASNSKTKTRRKKNENRCER